MLKKSLIITLPILTTACSLPVSSDIVSERIAVDSPEVSDKDLCLAALTSEVKAPKSKVQNEILRALVRKKITPEQCSSYAVAEAGGIDSFCSHFNYGYANGEASRMISFGNYASLQDMLSIQKNLGIDCNTAQYMERSKRAASSGYSMDFSKAKDMFKPKKTTYCSEFGLSVVCREW